MIRGINICIMLLAVVVSVLAPASADLSNPNDKTLYVVNNAHLDTQYRWTIKTTIDPYLRKTLDQNFAYFQNPDYGHYVFNFEGAWRYMLIKEYYPDKHQQMSDYIAQGRWNVAGSTIEQGDVNIVSPESLIRQILLGNKYFEDEYGKQSEDLFYPDCFGFGWALPSIAAHCGLKGISTSKLLWGCWTTIPFDYGRWIGPDGGSMAAALRPDDYVSQITSDLSYDSGWISKVDWLGNNYGVWAGYKYYGSKQSDTGGSPESYSVEWLKTSINGSGPLNVVAASTDQLHKDLTQAQFMSLPTYNDELIMKEHGTGCYTVQSAMKRWNRQNQNNADSAERISVISDWLGATEWPREALSNAWVRFLNHTHHDDLTGTSIPEVYKISWNDEMISLIEFGGIMENAVGGVAREMDTQVTGEPVLVYNPLSFEREDVVDAEVIFETVPQAVRVYNEQGVEVPSQVKSISGQSVRVLFLADVPAVGLSVYDVRPAAAGCTLATGLSVGSNIIENERYRVTINSSGDISSIYDKLNVRELLSSPSQLQLFSSANAKPWSAWEIRYSDITAGPVAIVGGTPQLSVIENGPARVTLQVVRTDSGSTFMQRISLMPGGARDRVEVDTRINWNTQTRTLKVSFPTTTGNSMTTYDLGLGTIQRPNSSSQRYEMPAQQWADTTLTDNSYGVAVLNDCKTGWDKPDDHTMRLTLIHTPPSDGYYEDHGTIDLGKHRLLYAVTGHPGDWRSGMVSSHALRINQPLVVFQASKHNGTLDHRYAFLTNSHPHQVAVRAIKLAERNNDVILRVQELFGQAVGNVTIGLGTGIVSAREVNGQEFDLGPATITSGQLVFDLSPYQPRTFALQLANPPVTLQKPSSHPLTLPYNMDAVSFDTARSDGNFEGGRTYPGELIPDTITVNDVMFTMGPRSNGQNNAVACSGQTIAIPTGNQYIYMLAASRNGDQDGIFNLNDKAGTLNIQHYNQKIVDWGRNGDAAYLKRDQVGWVCSHRHTTGGNDLYEFSNMFLYVIKLSPSSTTLTLPNNPDIVLFAATATDNPNRETTAAQPLFDEFPLYPDPVTTPPAPSNVTTTVLNAPLRIQVAWQDNSSGSLQEDGFIIERLPVNGQTLWTSVATLPADSTSWEDTNVYGLVQYFYRVGAYRNE